MNVESISPALRFDVQTGIWRAETDTAGPISYPAHQNDACFRLEDRSFWFTHRNKCVIAAVRRFPPDGFILDVGGGNGFVARGLIDAGYDTALLEPGGDGARNARQSRQLPTVINATIGNVTRAAGAPSRRIASFSGISSRMPARRSSSR